MKEKGRETMSRRAMKRMFAAMLSLLFALTAAPAGVFAQETGNSVGGTQTGNTNHPSTGEGTTDIWAGVAVDYMFPLRYEVYDEAERPLEGSSIEHYDYSGSEYLFVGRTDTAGAWETRVPPAYWMSNIQGASSGGEAAVVDTTGPYTGDGPLRHRVSKEGYETQEETAEISVEEINGKATAVVRVYMARQDASQGTDSGGNNTNNANTTPSAAGRLPQTGVQNYWICFAAAGLLLLIASVLLFKMLRDEKKKRHQKTTGGQTE